MGRILVGADGSDGAAVAVRWAAGAAEVLDKELTVATVVPAGAAQSEVDDAARMLEGSWCTPADEVGQPYQPVVLRGDPREALSRAAASEDVDVTVVGSRTSGWWPALHLGSVGHYLAQHSAGPVAIIPAGVARFAANRLTVGVDGSAGSLAALNWCSTLAASTGAGITVVHAYQPAARAGTLIEEPDRAELERRCRGWVAPLNDAGRVEHVDIVEGDPAKAIADAAAGYRSELIIVGTRGAGGFHGLRLGSVALKLLHHATLPTVVVPPQ